MDSTTFSAMEIESSPRDDWLWHEADFVVRCTRHKGRCVKDN